MPFEPMKPAMVACWVLSLSLAGYAIGIVTASGWAMLVALAVMPALLTIWIRSSPLPSMSESIQQVLGSSNQSRRIR